MILGYEELLARCNAGKDFKKELISHCDHFFVCSVLHRMGGVHPLHAGQPKRDGLRSTSTDELFGSDKDTGDATKF